MSKYHSKTDRNSPIHKAIALANFAKLSKKKKKQKLNFEINKRTIVELQTPAYILYTSTWQLNLNWNMYSECNRIQIKMQFSYHLDLFSRNISIKFAIEFGSFSSGWWSSLVIIILNSVHLFLAWKREYTAETIPNI